MKLDFSKLTAHAQKNMGQVGQRGQSVKTRFLVSPSHAESEGTIRDAPITENKCTATAVPTELICPTLSHDCPNAQFEGEPNDYRVSPSSPVVPLKFAELDAVSQPSVQHLCSLLGIDYAAAQKQILFDDHDLVLYRTGKRSVRWMIIYLVSWQQSAYCITFDLCTDAFIANYLNQLAKTTPSNKAAMAMWWINREASNET